MKTAGVTYNPERQARLFIPIQTFKPNLTFLNPIFLGQHMSTTICVLYYKHIMIVNYNSTIDDKFGASLTDDARVIMYDRHMFIVQATDYGLQPCGYQILACSRRKHSSLVDREEEENVL